MPRIVQRSLIFLVLLAPSAHYAWRERTMPDFGYLHDDGLFFVSAKSAAAGSYRIESLPEQPAQTKFPPLYTFYLSFIWRLNPRFPDNLPLATCFCWITLGVLIALSWSLYKQERLGEARAWILAGLIAVNPYVILFGTRMFSEIFFTCFVIATLLALRRNLILVAGILAGCAYLSRTAGLALLISVPLVLLLKRESRRAAIFLAAMLPFVAGWSAWARIAHLPTDDSTLIYYTDYLRYQFLNVGLSNIGVVLWKNVDQVLYAIGSLAMPKVFEILPLKILTQVIGIAMLTGTVRLARRGVLLHYASFALISIGMLLVWHFPPTERFVLPLFPLLIAGLAEELTHLGKMLRTAFAHPKLDQRIMAGIFALVAVAIFGSALGVEGYVTFKFLDESAQQKEAKLNDLRAAYSWISSNLPPAANVLSYDDPLLYLYTGHRGNYLPLPTRWWYAEDHASIVTEYRNVAEYCRSRNLSYVLFTTDDLSRETGEEDRQAIETSLRANPRLKPVYQSGMVTIFSLAPASPTR